MNADFEQSNEHCIECIFRNGKLIKANPAFEVFFDGQICRLTINEIFPEDSGLYKCNAKSKYGESQTSCLVDVEQKCKLG